MDFELELEPLEEEHGLHSRTRNSQEYGWQSPKSALMDAVMTESSCLGSLIAGVVLIVTLAVNCFVMVVCILVQRIRYSV